jgi:hypothetical protein
MRLHFPKPMRIYLTHDKATEYSQGVNEIPDKVASDYKKIFELNGVKPPEEPKRSATNTGPERKPATLEALTAECMKAGYPPQSALAGKHGEEAKYTGAGFQIPSDFAMPVAAPDAGKANDELNAAVVSAQAKADTAQDRADDAQDVADDTKGKGHADAQAAADDAQDKADVAQDKADNPVDLSAMTKAQLVDHAKEVHGIDLVVSDTKTQMLEQIAAVQK